MTGLISFILLVLGGICMISGGMLEAEGSPRSGRIAVYVGSLLMLCGWWLA